MYPRRRFRIKSAQEPVQRSGVARLARGQTCTQIVIARRTGEQSVQQRPKVEPGPASHHRYVVTCGNFTECVRCPTRELARSEDFVRINNVDEVVRDAAPLCQRHLGCPNVKMAIDLQRITIDDFALKGQGNTKGQVALAGTCRADNRNQREKRFFRSSRQNTVIQ